MPRAKKKAAPRPPAPAPSRPDSSIPSMDETARTIGNHILADSLDMFIRADRRAKVVYDRTGSSNDAVLNFWAWITQVAAEEARDTALNALIAWHHRPTTGRVTKLLMARWPMAGVVYRGKVYAAVHDRENDYGIIGEVGPHRVMELVELDLGTDQDSITDLETLTDLDAFFGRGHA